MIFKSMPFYTGNLNILTWKTRFCIAFAIAIAIDIVVAITERYVPCHAYSLASPKAKGKDS